MSDEDGEAGCTCSCCFLGGCATVLIILAPVALVIWLIVKYYGG